MNSNDIEELLHKRNQNLGAMFAAELADDYLRILYVLLQFRRDHELEVLRDVLLDSVKEIFPFDSTGNAHDVSRFDQCINKLCDWNIISKRLEKNRLRSYKDVRRDRFRYSLSDETVAFLLWLEERRENDLLPHEDDSIHLLEFILSAIKQISRALKTPEEHFTAVIFALGDVQEKTARLSQNLSKITIRLGEFLLRAYTAEEAREIVDGLDVYFKHYLEQLFKLRNTILHELESLNAPEKLSTLAQCFALFSQEQQERPSLMRVSIQHQTPEQQLSQLLEYYRRGGRVDQLCGIVHDNAMKVLGKLTSYLKELERRSNRLEFINLRLLEFAQTNDDFTAPHFLRELLCTAAAPLDMNDADEFQKAEPPMPRSGSGLKRIPSRTFVRTPLLTEKHVETHEEMRLRLLAEFLSARYPEGGALDSANLADGEMAQIAHLLKYGLLGNGKLLAKLGKTLSVDPDQARTIRDDHGAALSGPRTVLQEKNNR